MANITGTRQDYLASLHRELSKHTGEGGLLAGFEVTFRDGSEHVIDLVRGDEHVACVLRGHLESQIQLSDKLEISGRDTKLSGRSLNGGGILGARIRVGLVRGAAVVAKEIDRRLLSKYATYLREYAAKKAKKEEADAREAQIIANLREAAGDWYAGVRAGHMALRQPIGDGYGSAHASVGTDPADDNVHLSFDVSEATAIHILRALGAD